MNEVNFLEKYQKSTKRDYVERVVKYNKAECASKAKNWGFDYWDGDRRICYGGYKYDGRWLKVAQAMADHYKIKPGDKILDIGCGKAFLLYEFTQVVPGIEVTGIDISQYGIHIGHIIVGLYQHLGVWCTISKVYKCPVVIVIFRSRIPLERRTDQVTLGSCSI